MTLEGNSFNMEWVRKQKDLSTFLNTATAKNAYQGLKEEDKKSLLEKVYYTANPKKEAKTKAKK